MLNDHPLTKMNTSAMAICIGAIFFQNQSELDNASAKNGKQDKDSKELQQMGFLKSDVVTEDMLNYHEELFDIEIAQEKLSIAQSPHVSSPLNIGHIEKPKVKRGKPRMEAIPADMYSSHSSSHSDSDAEGADDESHANKSYSASPLKNPTFDDQNSKGSLHEEFDEFPRNSVPRSEAYSNRSRSYSNSIIEKESENEVDQTDEIQAVDIKKQNEPSITTK